MKFLQFFGGRWQPREWSGWGDANCIAALIWRHLLHWAAHWAAHKCECQFFAIPPPSTYLICAAMLNEMRANSYFHSSASVRKTLQSIVALCGNTSYINSTKSQLISHLTHHCTANLKTSFILRDELAGPVRVCQPWVKLHCQRNQFNDNPDIARPGAKQLFSLYVVKQSKLTADVQFKINPSQTCNMTSLRYQSYSLDTRHM